MDSGVHLFLKHAIGSTFQQGCASLRANISRKNLAPFYLPGDLAKWVSFKTLDVIVVVTGIEVVKQPVTGIHTILGCDCDKAKQEHLRIHKLPRTILL